MALVSKEKLLDAVKNKHYLCFMSTCMSVEECIGRRKIYAEILKIINGMDQEIGCDSCIHFCEGHCSLHGVNMTELDFCSKYNYLEEYE